MLYKQSSDKVEGKRRVITYLNERTGTEVKVTPIYKDASGVQWWGFTDLFKVPYIRQAYAKHITDNFTMGLSLKDILEWCKEEKELLKAEDPEKYEKLYALILQKERLASFTADPIKKHLALATVYVLEEDERIDYFDDEIAGKKMKLWGADLNATAFFLNWHNEATVSFMKNLQKTFKTVSKVAR